VNVVLFGYSWVQQMTGWPPVL